MWRAKYNRGFRGAELYASFLNHCVELNIKKIAYAASFGVDYLDYSDEQKQKCSELIQQFNYVSVHEESGISLCKQLGRNDAVCVIDPTLLIDSCQYMRLLKKTHEKYILAYILDEKDNKELITRLKSYAFTTDFTLKILYAGINIKNQLMDGFHYMLIPVLW